MSKSMSEEAPEVTPEQRQHAALAVISDSVVRRMGCVPGRKARRGVQLAESLATLEGEPDALTWARYAFRTRGVKR